MRSSRFHRRGYSLIEAVVVIAVMASLFAIAAVTFARFLAMRSSGQVHLERTTQLVRLADEFRSDVRRSQKIVSEGSTPEKLILTDGSQQTTYEIRDAGILRTTAANDNLRTTLQSESFKIPEVVPRSFHIDQNRVSLRLALMSPDHAAGEELAERLLPITATLGRDHRLPLPQEPTP